MRIDADVWPTPCVNADPISSAQRVALAGEEETRVAYDALQLREHVTRDEILAHRHDGIGLKAMLLRVDRQRQQRGAGED